MEDREQILTTLIDTNRSLARLIVFAERLHGPLPSRNELADEINKARDAYFKAKGVAINNGQFEGGYFVDL